MITKKEIVRLMSDKTNFTLKDSEIALVSFIEVIKENIGKNDMRIVGLGKFSTRKLKARIGRNPRTGDEVKIKAKKIPAFRASKDLKAAVK